MSAKAGGSSRSVIHIVAGPTAGGKSAKALELAAHLNGIIINCDSLQIYDGLPVLTAQPGEQDRQAVPHSLYGTLHPNDACSAGNWREMAQPVIAETLKAGKTPILTGGTGLYIKALTEGLSPMPDIPPEIREAASRRQKELGNPAFHAELQKRDPVMAERLDPYNTARLVRAWEVLEATGKSLAEWQKGARMAPPDDWDFEIHKIIPERNELIARCDARFLQMIDNGVFEEVESFSVRIDHGEIHPGAPLIRALGFRPLRACIKGEISRDEAIARAQGETRRYAKRQITWFRHQL